MHHHGSNRSLAHSTNGTEAQKALESNQDLQKQGSQSRVWKRIIVTTNQWNSKTPQVQLYGLEIIEEGYRGALEKEKDIGHMLKINVPMSTPPPYKEKQHKLVC